MTGLVKHRNITVRGKVQGVYFRVSTKDVADSLALTGFVRNEKDGSVYIEAEGDVNSLDRLVAWCGKGPPGAVVQQVDVADATVLGFGSFEIRRH